MLTSTPKRLVDVFGQNVNKVESCDSFWPIPKSEPSSLLKGNISQLRPMSTTPYRILDAPDLMDDYYLNLLDWGSNNTIAVALQQSVYLWNASSGSIEQLFTLENENDYVTSVKWSAKDNLLAVGTSGNLVQLWDSSQLKKVTEYTGHTARVASLSWNDNMISSGGRDSMIFHYDIRHSRRLRMNYVAHQQEVCGLSWSPDGKTLASGGNENLLCLWDLAMGGTTSGLSPISQHRPRVIINQHLAAVKALAWCPWQRNTLASGGGTADRTLRIWNTCNGTNMKCIDTASQVCAIQWSDTEKELVSSHGFSDNQLILWKFPTMTKMKEFRGHTSRVLHLAKSPDGTAICSASADETLRFWNIFNSKDRDSKSVLSSSLKQSIYNSALKSQPAVRKLQLLGASSPSEGCMAIR